MPDKIIAATLKLDGADAAEKSVKSFKTELKEANNELLGMSKKFGATSAEAVNAAKKVAGLKGSIADAKGLTDAFNPDKKFQAFSNAISGVIGGFAGLQGAMALFGGQSKEIEASLLKVQAAMALSQGVNSILESKGAFIALGAKIKDVTAFQKLNAAATGVTSFAMKGLGIAAETSSVGFKVLKGAIIATGIGALVIGIIALVQNFDSVKKAVLNLIPGLGGVANFIGKIINSITDFVGVTSEAERATDRLIKSTEKQIKKAEEFLDANGDKYDSYTQRKIKADIDYNKHLVEINKDATKSEAEKQELLKQYQEKRNREIDAADNDRLAKTKEGIDAEAKANQAAANEKQKQLLQEMKERKAAREKEFQQKKDDDAKLKEYNDKVKREQREQDTAEALQFAQEDEAAKKATADLADKNEQDRLTAKAKLAELNVLNNPDSSAAKIEKIRADLELELSSLAEGDLQKQILARKAANDILKIEQEAADAKVKIAKLTEEQKIEFVGNALGQIADIVGRETAVGKVLAVGQAIINTYQGATKALATYPPPWGQIAAGITIATGLANVKKILEVKLPGKAGGGGGGSMPSLSSSAVSAPAPLQPQVSSTALQQEALNMHGNAAAAPVFRTYVLDADIEQDRSRTERLNRAARLGN